MSKTEETEIYDWLLAHHPALKEPAVVRLGDRCVIGCWVALHVQERGQILKSRAEGVEVLGTGASWREAKENFLATRALKSDKIGSR